MKFVARYKIPHTSCIIMPCLNYAVWDPISHACPSRVKTCYTVQPFQFVILGLHRSKTTQQNDILATTVWLWWVGLEPSE